MLAALSSRPWRVLCAGLLGGLCLGYGVVTLAAWRCQICVGYFIFEPDRALRARASDFPFEVHDVRVSPSLHGWWVSGTESQPKNGIFGSSRSGRNSSATQHGDLKIAATKTLKSIAANCCTARSTAVNVEDCLRHGARWCGLR